MTYLPGNKDTIEPPQECRCHECRRPLTTGIGYFVIDEQGREFPTGPTCFTRLTGRPTAAAAVLALGTVKEKDNPGGGEVTRQQNEAARTSADTRHRVAKENVLLRAERLPQKGFANTDAELFAEFLPRKDALTDDDVREIQERVARVVKDDERKELKQLKWCNTLYGQMQRLLDWKEGYAPTKARIEIMKDHLRTYNGLLDKEMTKLAQWSKIAAKMSGIADSIEGVHFSTNQTRFDRYMERKGP